VWSSVPDRRELILQVAGLAGELAGCTEQWADLPLQVIVVPSLPGRHVLLTDERGLPLPEVNALCVQRVLDPWDWEAGPGTFVSFWLYGDAPPLPLVHRSLPSLVTSLPNEIREVVLVQLWQLEQGRDILMPDSTPPPGTGHAEPGTQTGPGTRPELPTPPPLRRGPPEGPLAEAPDRVLLVLGPQGRALRGRRLQPYLDHRMELSLCRMVWDRISLGGEPPELLLRRTGRPPVLAVESPAGTAASERYRRCVQDALSGGFSPLPSSRPDRLLWIDTDPRSEGEQR